LTIKELDQEDIALDIHHIFPQDWCEKQGIKRDTYNSIINKTPISYKANRKIGGYAPSLYLRKLQEEKTVQLTDQEMNALVSSHGIDASALRADNFERHYQARKLALLDLIQRAMAG
jgi:hypothetical protein